MNTKLSGAQLVIVPIRHMGRNYLPFIEYIDHRVVKYIDFAPSQYLPDTDAVGCTTTENLYLTIMNERGNTELHRNIPLERFDYTATIGVRQPIFDKMSLSHSYIDCQNADAVGTNVALVFWYDLPEYSQRNMTDTLITDSITIPIKNVERYNALPDDDRLASKRFRKILLGTPSITPDLQDGIAEANLANIYLTLQRGSYKVLSQVPILLLRQIKMLEQIEFQNIIFDMQSSYLTVGGASTIADPDDYIGKSVFLNVQYENK